MTVILETNRLTLRTWRPDDAEALFEICRHREVMVHIGTREPYQTIDDARGFINQAIGYQQANGFGRWAVVEKASGNLIGSCGFGRIRGRSEIELGYLFDRRIWGQGYATEAAGACLRYDFESLSFAEVIALTDPEHTASQRVLEKIGFVCQGIKVYDGDDEDMAYLAINPGA